MTQPSDKPNDSAEPVRAKGVSTPKAILLAVLIVFFLYIFASFFGITLGLTEWIRSLSDWLGPLWDLLPDDLKDIIQIIVGIIIAKLYPVASFPLLLIGLLTALIFFIIKYGPTALEWYRNHPWAAIFAGLALLLLAVILALVLELVIAAAITVTEFILIILIILMFLFALFLIVLGILVLLDWFFSWVKSKIRRICLEWVPQWELKCTTWQQACTASITIQRQLCQQLENALNQECDNVSGWRWWVCLAKRIVKTTRCRVWVTIQEVVCVAWGWVCRQWVRVWRGWICVRWG